MVRVLYVHSSLSIGGAQAVRYMFLKNLNRQELDIKICCLAEKGEFGEKIEKMGFEVAVFKQPYGLSRFDTTVMLYRYIRQHNFDIIHSSLFYANYHSVLAASWAKAPFLVIEEHGEHSLHLKRRHGFLRWIGKRVAQTSNLVLCCSDFVKNGVRDAYGVDEQKLVVIKNLVDDKRLEIQRTRQEIRKELNIPDDAAVIGTVSSLYWLKNQRVLIDALCELNDDRIFLIMTGDGPLKNQLIKYAVLRGVISRARFTGWRSDIPDILNSLDVFVLPSLCEGLPISLLEAMSIGLPCIASAAGGIGEAMEDGLNGILVKIEDPEALKEALKRLIYDRGLQERLGLAARKYVNNYFQPSHYVRKVVNSYTRLFPGLNNQS